ncbi:hypothetical protein TIFTF001_037898 [Ficus carica]|uniref:Uncharacterized protein n=1 Tax=Ficus carica TaxID=3494 RepID=A0AA88E690_FICCA|nr:hypothetical protein TIFTF001_037898 [Ficus carica]
MAAARPTSPISSCSPKAAIGSPTPVDLTANSQSRTSSKMKGGEDG